MTIMQYLNLAAYLVSAVLVVSGCERRIKIEERTAPKTAALRPDEIDLETALKNAERGEYTFIGVSHSGKFVSFQESADDKKQYYFNDSEPDEVLKKVADTIRRARDKGHLIMTTGLEGYLEED